MHDADDYGRFQAPGPSDPYAGGDPYGMPDGGDPYGSTAEPPAAWAATNGSDPNPPAGDASAPYGAQPAGGSMPTGGPMVPYAAQGTGAPMYYTPLPTSGSAVTSLVLGIVSLVMGCGLTAPFGLGFAIHGMQVTGRGEKGGRGLAIAGLVTSIVGTLLLLFWLAYIGLAIILIISEGQ